MASQRISHGSVLLVVLVALGGLLQAQTNPVPPLPDYLGTYSDAPGHTLEIVVGDGLFAVVDEAKYPLRRAGADKFKTITGGMVPFLRDASGKVTGYEQDGRFHPRVSAAVTPDAAALAWPRGQGYAPAKYRYRTPTDLHDGIAVGDIARSPLGAETANAIVRAILDGSGPPGAGSPLSRGPSEGTAWPPFQSSSPVTHEMSERPDKCRPRDKLRERFSRHPKKTDARIVQIRPCKKRKV